MGIEEMDGAFPLFLQLSLSQAATYPFLVRFPNGSDFMTFTPSKDIPIVKKGEDIESRQQCCTFI